MNARVTVKTSNGLTLLDDEVVFLVLKAMLNSQLVLSPGVNFEIFVDGQLQVLPQDDDEGDPL